MRMSLRQRYREVKPRLSLRRPDLMALTLCVLPRFSTRRRKQTPLLERWMNGHLAPQTRPSTAPAMQGFYGRCSIRETMTSHTTETNATNAPSADQSALRRHAKRSKGRTSARTNAIQIDCVIDGGLPTSLLNRTRRWSTGRRRRIGGDTSDILDAPVA